MGLLFVIYNIKNLAIYLAMNLIKTGGPLFLFISLILVLGISAYFGKSANLELEGYASRDGIPDDDYPTYSSEETTSRLTNTGVGQRGPVHGPVHGPAHGQINPISDYYRWLSFWDTVANSNDPQAAFQASNYVQKTSVVPPVCPVCPSCKNGMCTGVCPNCGGYGGSGTQGVSGHGFDDYNSYYGGGVGGGRGIPLTNLANNAGAGAVDVTKTVVNDAALLVGGAGIAATGLAAGAGYGAYKLANSAGGAVERGVKGAAGMAKDTVVGGVDLAKDAVGGTVDLAKDAVGGTVDLAKDAGKGVAGLLKANPTQVNNINTSSGGQSGGSSPGYNNGANSSGVNGGGPLANQSTSFIDPYSYNGALGNKGPSNYIPITTDFSAFGK